MHILWPVATEGIFRELFQYKDNHFRYRDCHYKDNIIVQPFNLLRREYWYSLQWRHNKWDGISNHQPQDCLLNPVSGADLGKAQSCASLAFVRGIHGWPVNSLPAQRPVTQKMFPFDDAIMGEMPSLYWNRAQVCRWILKQCQWFINCGDYWIMKVFVLF